jgi:hypothetical protein
LYGPVYSSGGTIKIQDSIWQSGQRILAGFFQKAGPNYHDFSRSLPSNLGFSRGLTSILTKI